MRVLWWLCCGGGGRWICGGLVTCTLKALVVKTIQKWATVITERRTRIWTWNKLMFGPRVLCVCEIRSGMVVGWLVGWFWRVLLLWWVLLLVVVVRPRRRESNICSERNNNVSEMEKMRDTQVSCGCRQNFRSGVIDRMLYSKYYEHLFKNTYHLSICQLRF